MAVEVQGLDELKRRFAEVPKAMRSRVLRNALASGARLVRDEAKRNAPVLSNTAKAPYRTPGTVRDAISVRTSKMDKRAGNVGVFVNVRPAKGAKFKTKTTKFFGLKIKNRVQTRASERGAESPTDPYYWRWLEFGTKKMTARPFLQKGAEKLGDALGAFEKSIAKWINGVDKGAQIK